MAPAPYFYQKQPPTPMIRNSGKLHVSEVMKAERENHFELVPQQTEHNQESTPSDDKQIQQNTRADIEQLRKSLEFKPKAEDEVNKL